MASAVVEDYLKAIYKLQRVNKRVTTTAVAKALNVKPASVTNMLKKLNRLRLIQYRSYQGVHLLPAGKKIALEVIRHHRLLELYLKEALGYSWDSVHAEAEKLEHHISEDFEAKIAELMGDPAFDPHGDPIPTKEGEVFELACDTMAIANPGDRLLIRRVDDSNPEILRSLEKWGLMPNVEVELIKKDSAKGPYTLKIGKRKQVIECQVADTIFVSLVEAA